MERLSTRGGGLFLSLLVSARLSGTGLVMSIGMAMLKFLLTCRAGG